MHCYCIKICNIWLLYHACSDKLRLLLVLHFTPGASETHTVPGNTHHCVLSGLTSNTSYRVSLQASSRRGLGPAAVRYYTTRVLLAIYCRDFQLTVHAFFEVKLLILMFYIIFTVILS